MLVRRCIAAAAEVTTQIVNRRGSAMVLVAVHALSIRIAGTVNCIFNVPGERSAGPWRPCRAGT
jgi:hypothetical protein